MVNADDVPRVVLENVRRALDSLDSEVRRSECGRLIFTADALHYVQGWEIHEEATRGRGALGLVAELVRRAAQPFDAQTEGARLLAEVASLSPAEQVRAISGSLTVPVTDIESATLGFFASNLEVTTAARGEVLKFGIERRHRGPVQAWLASLPRR